MDDINLINICYMEADFTIVSYTAAATKSITHVNWTPIGSIISFEDNSKAYQGTFDGNGYEVKNLYIYSDQDYQGLFGYVYNATIKNLGVSGSVTGKSWVGSVVGRAYGSTIIGCYNKATVEGDLEVGGIVGEAGSSSTVVACYNSGAILSNGSGYTQVGGIVGFVDENSKVTSCYSYGTVSCSNSDNNLGGVAGNNHGTISYCYYDKSTVTATGASNTPKTAVGNGSSDGTDDTSNVCGYDKDAMQSEAVVAMLNNGAYYYNQSATATVGAWEYLEDSYPVYNPSVTPSKTEIDIVYNSDVVDKEYYEIYTALGLEAFAQIVNYGTITNGALAQGSGSYFNFEGAQAEIDGKLMDDIDLATVCGANLDSNNGINWTPIGNYNDSSNNRPTYQGDFDGDGHEVKNLYIGGSTSTSGPSWQGLFGYVSTNAEIKNLGVSGSVKGYQCIAGVAGYVYNRSDITSCYFTGTVSGDQYVGGVGGYVHAYSNITGCYNAGDVSGNSRIGGVAGYAFYSTIVGCYNTGSVSGHVSNDNSAAYIGGVVGDIYDGSTVTSCYSYGTVSSTSDDNLGGVVGRNNSSKGLNTISYCYYDKSTVTATGATNAPKTAVGDGSSDGIADTSDVCGYDKDAMQSEAVVKLLNNGAYYYNDTKISTQPSVGAWEYSSGNYPVYDPEGTPSETVTGDA